MKKSLYLITLFLLWCSAANVCFAQTRAGGRVHVNRHDVQRATMDKNAWKENFPDNCDNRNAGNRNFQLVSSSNGHIEVYAVWYGGQIEHYAKYQFELGMEVDGTETKLFDGKGDVSAISNDPSKYSSNPGFAASIMMDPLAPFRFYIKYVDTDGKTVKHYSGDGYASLVTLYFANINRTVVCIGFEDSPEAKWGNGNPDFNDVVLYVQYATVTEKTEAKRFFCETMDSTGDYDYNDIVFDVHPLDNGTTEVTILALGNTVPVELSVAGETINECGETDLHKIFNTGYKPFNVGGSEVKEAKTFIIKKDIDLTDFTYVSASVTDRDGKHRIIRYNAKSSKGEAIIALPGNKGWMKEGVNIRKGYPKFFNNGWYNESDKNYLVIFPDYFRLKAVDGDVTLGMQKTGNPADCILQFSLDGNSWSEIKNLNVTTASLVTIPSGGTCYFRRGLATATGKISDDADNYWTFTMNSADDNAKVEAEGNIMSLLDMTCKQNNISNNAAFFNLFKDCTYLKSVTIPANVTSIGESLFSGCTGLTSIIVDSETPPSVGDMCFSGLNKDIPVYVPTGKGDAYRAAKGWNEFTNIIDYHLYDENAAPGTPEYYTCSLCGKIAPERQHVHHYKWVIDEHQHKQVCASYVGTCNAPIINEAEHSYDNAAEAGTVDYYTCGTCGYIDPVRQHVHHYEWIIDEHQHKQVCTSEAGTCIAPTLIEAEHNIHENIFCDADAANYYCDVCGYVDEEKKAQYGARDYMSMTAVGGDVKIGAEMYRADESDYIIQYSMDGVNWTNHAVNDNSTIVTLHNGETCYFRSGMPDVLTSVMDGLWNFTMTGTGTIEASGNVMSLLDRSCQSVTVGDYGLNGLFLDCVPLTVAPELPATELEEGCYSMMFSGCNKLRKAPYLPATTIKLYSYARMFEGCSSLDYVEADFTEAVPASSGSERGRPFYSATEDWLKETAPNGIVVLKREMIEKQFNTNDRGINIPRNWKRALKVKAYEDPEHQGNYYTTFYDSRHAYTLPEGVKAYTARYFLQKLVLQSMNGNVLAKDNAVLLHSEKSCDITMVVSESEGNSGAAGLSSNSFMGVDTPTAQDADHKYYTLANGEEGLRFYCMDPSLPLPANMALLPLPTTTTATSLQMLFPDANAGVGIEDINEDGNSSLPIYNLNGVQLPHLQKGVNINGGKKQWVK